MVNRNQLTFIRKKLMVIRLTGNFYPVMFSFFEPYCINMCYFDAGEAMLTRF